MYQSHNAQSYQAGRHATGLWDMAGGKPRQPHYVSIGVLLSALLLGAVAQGVQASSTGDNDAQVFTGSTFSGPSVARMLPRSANALTRLGDAKLESIRGRYVDARALRHSVGDEGSFVILWDERPTGSGNDTKSSLSSGLGNHQSTSVTTRREQ
jgi:hypothetical protein